MHNCYCYLTLHVCWKVAVYKLLLLHCCNAWIFCLSTVKSLGLVNGILFQYMEWSKTCLVILGNFTASVKTQLKIKRVLMPENEIVLNVLRK